MSLTPLCILVSFLLSVEGDRWDRQAGAGCHFVFSVQQVTRWFYSLLCTFLKEQGEKRNVKRKVIAFDCFGNGTEYALRTVQSARCGKYLLCWLATLWSVPQVLSHILSCAQLKGSDLEITITRGSSLPGPACAYVNLNICTDGSEQGKGV